MFCIINLLAAQYRADERFTIQNNLTEGCMQIRQTYILRFTNNQSMIILSSFFLRYQQKATWRGMNELNISVLNIHLTSTNLKNTQNLNIEWGRKVTENKFSIRRIQLYRTVLNAKIEIFQKSIETLIDHSKVVINVFKHHK